MVELQQNSVHWGLIGSGQALRKRALVQGSQVLFYYFINLSKLFSKIFVLLPFALLHGRLVDKLTFVVRGNEKRRTMTMNNIDHAIKYRLKQ